MRARTRRTTERVALSLLLSSLLATLAAGLQGPVLRPDVVRAEARVGWTLEGTVLEPDGRPAAGAVVVTSAGGKAVVAADGSYRLVVDVPLAAEAVQVTAVGRGGTSRSASARVGMPWTGLAPVPPLVLAVGGACATGWLPTFGEQPGTDQPVLALAVYDDGSGPALFVGGTFDHAGTTQVNHVAKWDGTSWSALAGGTDRDVHSLAVFDDGTGEALYAGGKIVRADGVLARRVARWDGTTWSALGEGLSGTGFPVVNALAVHDDGSGPALYAGGDFLSSGALSVRRVARWDGTSWSALGAGIFGPVEALTTHDDGGGPRLYAGGSFTQAGAAAANGIAAWDGASWSVLGAGVDGAVSALAVFDGGSGPELCAGGTFDTAGAAPAANVARWDGASWHPLGTGADASVLALRVHDLGGGPVLVAGGTFTSAGGTGAERVAAWDGASWSALGAGVVLDGGPGVVSALASFDSNGAATLVAGGWFTVAGGTGANHVACWSGAWDSLGSRRGLSFPAFAFTEHDDGTGPALYLGGAFVAGGGSVLNRVARWDGTTLSPLGGGTDGAVFTLESFDDGGGPALYAGGGFQEAGGVQAAWIAKWDGTNWSPLGNGVSSRVWDLDVFDSGSGPELIAAGDFIQAGMATAHYIARWNGVAWAKLDDGLNSTANALVVHDDGGGEALYVGGAFSLASGVLVQGIARWDGASWSNLGSGLGWQVEALCVFDDGGGPALYAAGDFDTAGGLPANGIAKWDGLSWSPLGAGLTGPPTAGAVAQSLASFDAGSGPALYVGGYIATAGGLAVNNIARWDGSTWSAVGGGTDVGVQALRAYSGGAGPALLVGGSFDAVPGSGDSYFSRWGCDTIPPVIECPTSVTAYERPGSAPGEVVTFTVTALDGIDPAPVVQCVPPSGSLFPFGTTLVTCTATDSEGNQAQCQFPVIVRPKAAELGF